MSVHSSTEQSANVGRCRGFGSYEGETTMFPVVASCMLDHFAASSTAVRISSTVSMLYGFKVVRIEVRGAIRV